MQSEEHLLMPIWPSGTSETTHDIDYIIQEAATLYSMKHEIIFLKFQQFIQMFILETAKPSNSIMNGSNQGTWILTSN